MWNTFILQLAHYIYDILSDSECKSVEDGIYMSFRYPE